MSRNGWEPEVYRMMIQFIREKYLNMTEEELDEYIRKHPEILEAARRDMEREQKKK